MALRVFSVGKFTLEGATIGYNVEQTLTVNIAVGDISVIGTAWDAITELGRGWEVSCSTNYDSADPAQAAVITAYTSGAAFFSAIGVYENASVSHSGSGYLTSAVVTKAVGQVDKLNMTFKGNGVLAHA